MLFKIRKEQMQILAEDRLVETFATAMEDAWPEVCGDLGPAGVRARVKLGFEKAKQYEIQEQPNVKRFINLMFLLNRDDLDTAPETEWAGTILGWPDASEFLKLDALEKRAEIEMDALLD